MVPLAPFIPAAFTLVLVCPRYQYPSSAMCGVIPSWPSWPSCPAWPFAPSLPLGINISLPILFPSSSLNIKPTSPSCSPSVYSFASTLVILFPSDPWTDSFVVTEWLSLKLSCSLPPEIIFALVGYIVGNDLDVVVAPESNVNFNFPSSVISAFRILFNGPSEPWGPA